MRWRDPHAKDSGRRAKTRKPQTFLIGHHVLHLLGDLHVASHVVRNFVASSTLPPPPAIGVSVSPASASVTLGATQQFTATVTNSTNVSVTWNVNGITGGNSTVGTISAGGLYTAPQILPQPASVTIQAVSQADGTTSGSAQVTIIGGTTVTVTVAPTSANLLLGASQQFSATVSNAANQSVTWNVNGILGGSALVGTISATGLFTAPQILPEPASAVVQAVSQADSAASATVPVTITSDVAISVTPSSAGVELGAIQSFVAHITSAGNPNSAVTWTVAGIGCVTSACGTIDANGDYTAPRILPSPAAVTVSARSVADATKIATVPVTITSRFTFTVTGPASVDTGATANYIATLTPILNSNPNLAISWTVTGTGCAGAACGTISPSGLIATYQAPISAPTPSSRLDNSDAHCGSNESIFTHCYDHPAGECRRNTRHRERSTFFHANFFCPSHGKRKHKCHLGCERRSRRKLNDRNRNKYFGHKHDYLYCTRYVTCTSECNCARRQRS